MKRLNAKTVLLLSTIVMIITNCSTIRQIRPLEKGQQSVSFSVGGPVTEVGSVYIPLPLMSFGYNRGLIDNTLDLETGLHVTQLLYGILDVEVGVNFRPFQSKAWQPGLIISPKLFFMTDFSGGARLYPDLCLTGFWKLHEKVYLFTGLENWFEFSSTRDDGLEQKNHWLLVPYIGTNIGSQRWQFQFETRVYTPNLKNTGRATKNIGFGEYGVLGFFLGVNFTPGKEKK